MFQALAFSKKELGKDFLCTWKYKSTFKEGRYCTQIWFEMLKIFEW